MGSGEVVRRVLLGVLAVSVLVAVGVAGYRLAGGRGAIATTTAGDAPASRSERADGRDPDAGTPSVTTPVLTEEIVVGGRLALTLPADWASTEPGVGPSAQALFPDDAAAAAVFDQYLSQQVPGSLVFAAARASFDGGVPTTVVADFVAYGEGAGFDAVAADARPSIEAAGATVERQEPTALGGAAALRVNYRVRVAGTELTGLRVLVDAGDGAFVLTFQTEFSGRDAAVVDEIVATIEVR